jgi:Haem-NO-binding
MYGLVNKALRDLICTECGEPVWHEVRARAGVEEDMFIGSEGYDDAITYKLVGAACEVTGRSGADLLHAFGEHWVLRTARDGYGTLMDVHGKTLPQFLINLPNFHRRVEIIFPRLQPPRFEVTDQTENSLHLHYRTHRPGLSGFVLGLISGLGKLFNTAVTVNHIQQKDAGADHDVFHIQWTTGTGGA